MTSESVHVKGDDYTSRTVFHQGYRFTTLSDLIQFAGSIADDCDIPSTFAYAQIAMCGPTTRPACETPLLGFFGASQRPQSTQGDLQYGNLQAGNLLCNKTTANDVLHAFNERSTQDLAKLKETIAKTQNSGAEEIDESALPNINDPKDILKMLQLPKADMAEEQRKMVSAYRHKRHPALADKPSHPAETAIKGMSEGCPAAAFVMGVVPDVREVADREPIVVPIAFYSSRVDANALLAAIRERVPRLSLSLYIMPPALLFNPNDMDAVTDAVHSSSPEIDKMLTDLRATDAKTADAIQQMGLRKLLCGQLVNRLLGERPDDEDTADKTRAVLKQAEEEIGAEFAQECEAHVCHFLGLTEDETKHWCREKELPAGFEERVRRIE